MRELLMKVAEIRLKVIFRPKCLYSGLWEINWYRHPYKIVAQMKTSSNYLDCGFFVYFSKLLYGMKRHY